jgi:hypothetical protein
MVMIHVFPLVTPAALFSTILVPIFILVPCPSSLRADLLCLVLLLGLVPVVHYAKQKTRVGSARVHDRHERAGGPGLTIVVDSLPVPRDLEINRIRRIELPSVPRPLALARPPPEMSTHLDGVKLYPGDQDRIVLVVLSLGISSEDRPKVVIRDELFILFHARVSPLSHGRVWKSKSNISATFAQP